MAISEKDIFQSLMKDPNHAYRGLEKVWAEAQQRARQFRNNEKALSLAIDDSPLNKLLAFVSKAAEDDSEEADLERGGKAQRELQDAYEHFLVNHRYFDFAMPDNGSERQKLGVSDPFRHKFHTRRSATVDDQNQPGREIRHGRDTTSPTARRLYEKSIETIQRILNDDSIDDDFKTIEEKILPMDILNRIRTGDVEGEKEWTPLSDISLPALRAGKYGRGGLKSTAELLKKEDLQELLTTHFDKMKASNPIAAEIYNADTLQGVVDGNQTFASFPPVRISDDGNSFIPIADEEAEQQAQADMNENQEEEVDPADLDDFYDENAQEEEGGAPTDGTFNEARRSMMDLIHLAGNARQVWDSWNPNTLTTYSGNWDRIDDARNEAQGLFRELVTNPQDAWARYNYQKQADKRGSDQDNEMTYSDTSDSNPAMEGATEYYHGFSLKRRLQHITDTNQFPTLSAILDNVEAGKDLTDEEYTLFSKFIDPETNNLKLEHIEGIKMLKDARAEEMVGNYPKHRKIWQQENEPGTMNNLDVFKKMGSKLGGYMSTKKKADEQHRITPETLENHYIDKVLPSGQVLYQGTPESKKWHEENDVRFPKFAIVGDETGVAWDMGILGFSDEQNKMREWTEDDRNQVMEKLRIANRFHGPSVGLANTLENKRIVGKAAFLKKIKDQDKLLESTRKDLQSLHEKPEDFISRQGDKGAKEFNRMMEDVLAGRNDFNAGWLRESRLADRDKPDDKKFWVDKDGNELPLRDVENWTPPDDPDFPLKPSEEQTASDEQANEYNDDDLLEAIDSSDLGSGLITEDKEEFEAWRPIGGDWGNRENQTLANYITSKDNNLPPEDADIAEGMLDLTKDSHTNGELVDFRENLKSAWVTSIVNMSKNYPMKDEVYTSRNGSKTYTKSYDVENFTADEAKQFNEDMTKRAMLEGWLGTVQSALMRKDAIVPLNNSNAADLAWTSARHTSIAPPFWPTSPSGDPNDIRGRFGRKKYTDMLREALGSGNIPKATTWQWWQWMESNGLTPEGIGDYHNFMKLHPQSNKDGGMSAGNAITEDIEAMKRQVPMEDRTLTTEQQQRDDDRKQRIADRNSALEKVNEALKNSAEEAVKTWATSPKGGVFGEKGGTRTITDKALAEINPDGSPLTEEHIEALINWFHTKDEEGNLPFKPIKPPRVVKEPKVTDEVTDASIDEVIDENANDIISGDDSDIIEGTEIVDENKAEQDAAKLRATTNKKINRIMREQFGTGAWQDLAEDADPYDRPSSEEDTSIMFDWLKNMPPDELDKNYNKLVVEEHIKQRADAKKKAPSTEPLDDTSREELISRIKDAYSNMHPDTEVPDNFSHMLSTVDDKELRDQYKAYMKREMDHHSTEANTQRKLSANDLSSFTPLEGQDGVDNADVLFQARRLNQHESKYGLYIDDKAAKEKLSQLKDEVKAKAEEFGMDITDLASRDKAEAEEAGITLGSDEWMDYLTDKHVEEANTAAEQAKYIEENGADLRGNVNYKPNIVVDYDENGNGRLYDLASKRYVNKEDVRFSDDHIAAPWKSDEDASAEEAFWDKIDYETLLPKNEGGEVESIERFKNTAQDPRETNGFFHPESGAWINPHRYHETMQNGVEDLIIPVGGLYQGANKNQGDNDPMYSFSKLSSRQQGKMSGSDGYFIDTMGNIHGYAAPGHKNQDSKTPQSVNDVVYNWYSQQIAQRMQEGEQSSVIPVPSATPSTSYESALARRGKEVSAVDSYMGYDRGFFGRPQGQLTDAELGVENPWWQQQRWMGVLPEEWRQKFLDVVEYPQFQILSGLGKVLVNGYGTAAGAARRARYSAQIAREAETRTRSQQALMNQDYLSPGEERARKEDVQTLHTDLAIKAKEASRQVAEANKAATEATKNGNKQQADQYKAEADKQKKLADNLGRKIDSLKPLSYGNRDDWGKINTLYNEHQSEFPNFGIGQRQPVVTQDTSGRRQVADIPAMPQQGMTTSPTQQSQPSGQGLQGLIGGTSTPQPAVQGLISGGEQPQTETPAPQEENKPPLAGLIQ